MIFFFASTFSYSTDVEMGVKYSLFLMNRFHTSWTNIVYYRYVADGEILLDEWPGTGHDGYLLNRKGSPYP